jgi:putative redox protein
MAEQADADVGEVMEVAETRLGKFQVIARTAGAAFMADEPVAVGGLGTGPGPYDLLSAALGSCTAMTIRLYADRKGWPLARVRVRVLHHRATLEARDLFDKTILLEGALDEAQRARLLDVAKRCPVHLTLERGADVRTMLADDHPAPHDVAAHGEHAHNMAEAVTREV